ncbi:MAG: hypothetical protein ACFE9T_10115 [Promethearchaeota archaeon]
MPSKKYLSNKKTSQQTISISPALKEWINRFVRVNYQKNPEDKRFKSVSAFYNYVMEKTMGILAKGKTLDDFESVVDGEIRDFFDKISFKGTIPYYENAVEPNRYTNLAFEKTPFFLIAIRDMYLGMIDPNDTESIEKGFQRVRNYMLKNKLTKNFRLDIFTEKNGKHLTGIFEYIGTNKNLHFENCKYNAAAFGILGAKIKNCIYSERDLYCRFDLETTDLWFKQTLAKKERMTLLKENISYLVNYERIMKDMDYYLWMKMANDRDFIISFNDEKIIKEWLELVENDFKKFGESVDIPLNILRFFEKLHWINIESEKDLIFQLRFPKTAHGYEREFLLNSLSKYGKISQDNERFYLEKK